MRSLPASGEGNITPINKYEVRSMKYKVQRTKQRQRQINTKRELGNKLIWSAIASMSNASPKPFDLCERTFLFALDVVKVCQLLEKRRSSVAWTLSRQILRSATSVGANVEEAQGGQSKADFVSKYSIARKEVRETKYWLRLLKASDILTEAEAACLLREADELLRILTVIIKKTRLK